MKEKIFFIFIIACLSAYPQGEYNNWYFGENAGIRFVAGNPVALTNGALNTYEGSASISDKNGNLLFYTDGTQVWNKNHIQMPNGSGLFGHWSSTQSCLIIPWPGNPDKYYIFTADAQYYGFNRGLCYSVVDMNQDGGLGDITIKNVQLYTQTCEKLAAVQDRSGCNTWIVSHKWQSNSFYVYKISASGINTTPVISNTGRFHGTTGPITSPVGQLKISPDGKKIALTATMENTSSTNSMEIFNFNTSTGIVSNPIVLTTGISFGNGTWTQAYGCEFSPNGKLLYGASMGKIYQFDISSGIQSVINASKVDLPNSGFGIGSLQLAPNGKIYHTASGILSLNAINNPNTPGTGCNFVVNAVSLNGKKGSMGLPSRLVMPIENELDKFTVTDTCLTNNTNLFITDTTDVISSHWNFGDPASTNNTSTNFHTSHIYTSAGTYMITLIRNFSCKSDTAYRNINILPEIKTEISSTGSADCSGLSNILLTPVITNAALPYTYLWSNGSTENYLPNATVGRHSLYVTDINGCKDSSSILLASDETYELFVPNTFTPNNDGVNDIFLPKGVCIEEYQLYIFNRWGNLVFTSNDPAVGWTGKLNNTTQAAINDTYAWRIRTKDYFGEEHHYKGHVNLLK